MTTTAELVALILPWAKEHEPEKYEATLKVATNDKTFRRYLIRLIEIRWAREDYTWRRTIPLDVLEDSALTMTVTHRPTGRRMHVKGRLAEGPREWSFGELAMLTDEPERMGALFAAKDILDLEHNPTPGQLVPARVLSRNR